MLSVTSKVIASAGLFFCQAHTQDTFAKIRTRQQGTLFFCGRRIFVNVAALTYVLMPVLGIALALSFGVTGSSLVIVAVCSAVPTSSSAYVLARQMGGDAPLLAQIITLQTVLAAITMPIVIALVTTAS